MPTIIGLGYKARQGKNYVANYMQEYNPQVQIYAFADELKLYCKEHHNELEPQWQLAHQTKAHPAWKADAIYGCTPILQWYGTDVARKENPNVWVQALDKRLSREAPEIAVVTDVRFENEAKYIKEKGGYLVQVIRRNADGTQFVDSGRDPNHISETALDAYGGFDFIIEAKNGELHNLKRRSIGVLNAIHFDQFRPEEYKELTYVDEAGEFSEAIFDSFIDADGNYNVPPDSDSTGFKS